MTASSHDQGVGKPIQPPFSRPVRSYVLRQGRFTPAQKRALREFWPNYGLEVEKGLIDTEKVFARKAKLVMEIGFGMGDSLFTMLQEQPDSDFIGVEVHSPGVGHLLHRVAKAAAGNLRIYKADATDVLQRCLPDDSLDRVQIYFPDPWPKKRHHKRRLIDAHFVDLLAPKLKSAGRLHVATDSSQYADSMRAVIDASDHFTPLSDDEISRPKTKYEQRAERSEHRVFDLCYLKH